MENFQKYLSTAPVLLTIWMTFTAGFIIEINRFFPRYVRIILLIITNNILYRMN
jgi:photosystem I subunit 9